MGKGMYLVIVPLLFFSVKSWAAADHSKCAELISRTDTLVQILNDGGFKLLPNKNRIARKYTRRANGTVKSLEITYSHPSRGWATVVSHP